MLRNWSKGLRPVALGAASLGLVVGVLGATAGLAVAAPRNQSVYKLPAYVGGHGRANRKLSPITIGVVNQQTSTNAPAPVWSTGVKVAVKYINQHTHGIDGHPLKAVYCTIATTVSNASKCGQEFANNGSISVVDAGAIVIGNTALESALQPSKKPIFFSVSLSPVDAKDPNAFILYGDAAYEDAAAATFAKKVIHAKRVSITYPSNIPSDVAISNLVSNALKFEGVTVDKVGYTSSETNLTAPFEAAHVATTTLFFTVTNGGTACSDTYLALKSLGLTNKKVLTTIPCDTPTVAKADGGQLPHDWYYETADPVPGSPTKVVGVVQKVAAKYGKGAVGLNPWVYDAFGETLTIAKIDTELLKEHKKITPATMHAKARAFKGPVLEGAPHLDCGGTSGAPGVCSNVDTYYENTAPNVMKPVARWIGPPKGFKVTVT